MLQDCKSVLRTAKMREVIMIQGTPLPVTLKKCLNSFFF